MKITLPLLSAIFIFSYGQLWSQQIRVPVNVENNQSFRDNHLHEEPIDAHRQAVLQFLNPGYLFQRFVPLMEQIGIDVNDVPAFIDYCEPLLADFNYGFLKLQLEKSFTTSAQVDSFLQAHLPLFVSQKARFYSGLEPLAPEFANITQKGNEFKLAESNNLSNLPLIANGPCVNMNFADGTTNGWSGSYGTSTIPTPTNEKTCANVLKSYNPSTDQCCFPFNTGCTNWTPADGYVMANLNNPNQTSGFNTAPNNTSATAATNGVHVVMTGGFDPIIPGNALSVVPPGGGNSIRLGWGKSGYNAQAIRQTFLVTNDNKNFVYKFACVLNDPETGHLDYELPYFRIRMYDQNNNVISCASLDVSTSNAVQVGGFTKVSGQPIYWKNWTSVTIPLNAYMGQNVTIEFVTSNCAQSGHYGYAYISAECLRQEIIASSPAICGGSTITLTAPPGLASYNWVGPGIVSGQGTQTIVINAQGTYQVTMTTNTTPPFIPCTFSIDTLIPGNPSRPFAGFTAPSGCFGSPIQFTDQSSPAGQITSWEWDFDNNSTTDATTQNPTYTFPAPGTYPVKLSVTWPPCSADTTINVIITAKPIANFTAPSVCLGNVTSFTNTTNLNGASGPQYIWNFGDPPSGVNNTSSQTNPTHAYSNAGTYNVTLTVNTPNCVSDTTIPVNVFGRPRAQFTADQVCFGNTTSFNDISTTGGSPINTWVWIFSDPNNTNNTSGLQNPTHTYTGAGSFPVTLVVTNSNNCSKDTTITVVVHPNPVSDFLFTNTCADSANSFNASSSSVSTGSITTYQWDVNNSITSFEYTGLSASHFAGVSGTYDVSLVVTTNNGCKDTITKTVNVWPEPTANFNSTTVCANTATNFTSTSTVANPGSITQWSWDFNNDGTMDGSGATQSYTYAVGGIKTVELNVKTNHGCTDKITKSIYVNYIPVSDFTVTSRCVYDALTFNNTATVTGPATVSVYSWNFGNGQTSSLANPTQTFASCNTYNVQLTVTTDSGCTSSVTKPVVVYCKPVAQFSKNDICTYQVAQFNGSASGVSDGSIASYQWDFNLNSPPNTFDNQASGVQVTSNYPPGNYPVGLIVTSNFGCKDTITDTIQVYQKPTAAFTPNAVCYGSPSAFQDGSTINTPETIIGWSWDFMNDGSIDNSSQNPTFVFPTDGSTPVKLIVTSDRGCKDTLIKLVMVNSIPKPNFTATNVCLGNITQFTNSSTINLGNIASYSWAFGNGQSSGQVSPSLLYTSENQYQVCLYATSDQQCKDSLCKNVTVYPLPNANFVGLPTTGCEPLITTFNNLSTVSSVNPNSNDQIASYSWVFGDGGTIVSNTGNSVSNTYSSGTYTVSLFVTTNNGCKDDTTFYNYVTAYPLPKANFSFNPQPTTILKPVINFLDLSYGGDTVWWDFGDGTQTLVVDAIGDGFYHEYTDSGKFVVTQIVKTEWGCIDSIKKVIYIGPDWALYVPNAFTPNGDGINDFFMAKGFGIVEFEMRIYDRWGNFIGRVADFTDEGWNGKVQDFSEEAQIDVYVYRINFKDVFLKPHQLTGTFTLVR